MSIFFCDIIVMLSKVEASMGDHRPFDYAQGDGREMRR
jgi:hypothetical protein